MNLRNTMVVGLTLIAGWRSAGASPTNAGPAGADTVMLLHGMGRSPRSMAWLGRQLEEHGFRVVNLSYPSTRLPIESLAAHLLSHVQREATHPRAAQVHFVTHSLGGIVLRAALKESCPPNLGRVVMLGPPNQGSEIVDRVRRVAGLRHFLVPAGCQLGTEAGSVPNTLGPVSFELGVIAGSRSLNPLFSGWLAGPDDGKVSVERARVEGMKDFLVVPHTHTFLMKRRGVAAQVIHFLQQGAFSRPRA